MTIGVMTFSSHSPFSISESGLKRQKGFSLIELMVAGALGTFILAGMIQVLSSAKDTFLIGSALTEIQEGGHFALSAIATPLRYRGFQGCLLPASLNNSDEENLNWDNATYTVPVANDFPSDNIARTNLRGFSVDSDGTWWPEPSVEATNTDIIDLRNGIDGITPREGSDVISVQYASPDSLSLAENMAGRSAPLVITDTTFSLRENDLVYIGDCSIGDVFRVSNEVSDTPPFSIEHDSSHNSTNNLRRAYQTDATIRLFRSDTYFVADSGRNNEIGDDVYSLFRLSANGDVDEIAEGVEYIKALYGEQIGSGNIRFLPASDADLNMRRVISIELGIIVKSLQPALKQSDTRHYVLPGATISATQHGGGNYLRKVFNTTVQMRNKG